MLRVDVYFLAALTRPEVLGIYGICLQIITIVKKIKQSFDPILEPVIANSIKIENLSNVANELARVSNLIFWIQSMIFTFLIFYCDELLLLFAIDDSAASLTLLLLISSVVISSTFGLSELIFLNKKPTINFYISTIMLLIHVVFCYLLISIFGILGAGLAMAISYSLRSVFQLYLMKRIYKVLPLNRSILVSVGGCILLFVYLFLINNVLDISSPFSIVLGIIGGLVIYISYGYFAKSLNNQF
jgi:stage V sporulation protein B